MKKFPICFWNYATFDQMGENPVKDWVDAGFSMALSPVFRVGVDKPERMVRLLDECLENNISVIIDDIRCKWDGVLESEEDYRKNFSELLKEYGNHKAVFGFYVGDEPRADKMPAAIKAVRIQKELAPEKEPFINFNPYWDGNESTLGGVNFDDWAHDFMQSSGLSQFCYDAYDQMNPDDASHRGINFFFMNLLRYSRVAKRENVPFWTTNLIVPHFRFRVPTEDDIRWQFNAAVASGASCIWWYFMYLRLPRLNYRLAPIDENGNRTEAYTKLARVQNMFQHQYGELFTNLVHDETYHTALAFGGYPALEYNTHKYLKEVVAKNEVPGLVSFFHSKNGDKYMVFVNNNTTESDLFKFKFTKNVKEIYRVVYGLSPEKTVLTEKDKKYPVIKTENGSFEVNCLKNDNANNCYEHNGELHNEAWLAPGQMEVYRIVTE
ncbi:MAG: hypothetical protein IKI68_00290 [Clostridia bacterium]|nr:hypothetical protein [Clostridia bacterium]